MATETVQKQSSKIKETPEELMATFESFTPEAKLDLIGSMGMFLKFQEEDEKIIEESQAQGMTREEAKAKLTEQKEQYFNESMKPKEKTEQKKQQEELSFKLFGINDDILDHAGELQFLTTAIDKILFIEDVYGCDHAAHSFGRLIKAMEETAEKVVIISKQLDDVAA